jgi:hypothetical protein
MLLNTLSIYLPIFGCTALCWALVAFQFFNPKTVGRTLWTGDEPVLRPLPRHRTTQTQNESKQISVPRVGFEPMIPLFERAKTVHVLDRAVTVIGKYCFYHYKLLYVT